MKALGEGNEVNGKEGRSKEGPGEEMSCWIQCPLENELER